MIEAFVTWLFLNIKLGILWRIEFPWCKRRRCQRVALKHFAFQRIIGHWVALAGESWLAVKVRIILTTKYWDRLGHGTDELMFYSICITCKVRFRNFYRKAILNYCNLAWYLLKIEPHISSKVPVVL